MRVRGIITNRVVRKGYLKKVRFLWKTVWRFLKKLKIKLPYHSAIPPLGIYPEQTKTLI